jgi:hypothetical protein
MILGTRIASRTSGAEIQRQHDTAHCEILCVHEFRTNMTAPLSINNFKNYEDPTYDQ